MPRWLARMLRHSKKAQRLTTEAEKQQKKVGELVESAAHHIHRAKH